MRSALDVVGEARDGEVKHSPGGGSCHGSVGM